MAKSNSGGGVGGFVFNVFNIGFTVFMFILPTIGLVYWYLYIRDPGGGATQRQVNVQAVPAPTDNKDRVPPEPAAPSKPAQPLTSGFFDEPFGPSSDSSDGELKTDLKPNPPARKEYETRTWSDASGKFSIQAKFYRIIGDRVKIIAADGREIEVPIAQLGEEDKEYLRTIFKEKGIQPSF